MVQGPEGIKQLAPQIIHGRDLRGAAAYKRENPELAQMVEMQPFLFLDEEIAGERQTGGVRFHRFAGILYLPSWIHKKAKNDEREVPFSTRPKGEGDMYLRWGSRQNIEGAIRSTIHVVDQYIPTGPVQQKAETLLEYLDELGDRFEEGHITRENLPFFIDQALNMLESTGYLNPIKLNKTKVAPQLLEALSPDSRGRFPNKLIAQTRLASVWVKVRHEQISANKVTMKYERYFPKLYEERLRERLAVHEVRDAAREVQKQVGQRAFATSVLRLRRSIRNQFGADRIRVAPYRIPSLLFAAGLFGATSRVLRYDSGREPMEWFTAQLQEIQSEGTDWPDSRILTDQPIDEVLADPSLSEDEKSEIILERVDRYLPALIQSYEQGRNWRLRANGEILHAV